MATQEEIIARRKKQMGKGIVVKVIKTELAILSHVSILRKHEPGGRKKEENQLDISLLTT